MYNCFVGAIFSPEDLSTFGYVSLRSASGVVAVSLPLGSVSPFNFFSSEICASRDFRTNSASSAVSPSAMYNCFVGAIFSPEDLNTYGDVSLRSALGVVAVFLSLRSASPFNVFSSAILTRCLFFTDSFCSVIQASSSKRLALSSNSGRRALSPSSSSSCFSLAILARRLFFTNSFCSIIQA